MQWLVFAIALSAVLVAVKGSQEQVSKISAAASQMVTQYADVGIDDAKNAVIADLQSQVPVVGPDGPFTDPVAAPPTPACASVQGQACPYDVQTTVHYTGSLAAGGSANDTANNLNRYATLDESVVYVQLTATVYLASNNVQVAATTSTLTLHTKKTPPYVLDDATNNATALTELQAEHDNQGCDPTNPTSCGQTGNATPANTEITNFLRCADDGNPADGLCGPATPEPANNYQTVQTHSGNVQ
jgi:hypothetical protein